MTRKALFKVAFSSVMLAALQACVLCPPAGPWPQPPGCGGGTLSPGQSARNDNGCFPPSCDMIPDEAARIMCQQFKDGQDVWDWPRDCSLLPTNACSELCTSEVQRYIDTGHQNWEAGIKNNTDWWKEPYTKVYVFGTVNEFLEILQPDAHPWAAAPNEDDLLKIEIAYSHYYNMPHAGNNWFNYIEAIDPATKLHLVANMEEQVPPELQPAMRRNLEGEIVRQPYVPGIDIPGREGNINFNGFHPEFMAYVIQEWKHNVDFEADGVMIDNLRGIPKPEELATYFDDYTVKEFNTYLREELSAQDWQKLGAKPDTFDYTGFLRSKGYTSASFMVTDGSWRQIPLVLEFRTFLAQKNAEAFCSMSDQIHTYAKELGRTVTVSANMGGTNNSVPQEACVDFITSEYTYIGLDKPYVYHTVVPWAKFGDAKDKPMLNVRHNSDGPALNEFTLDDPNVYVNFYRLSTMESYAARSSQIHMRSDSGHLGDYVNNTLQAFKMRYDTSRLEQIKVAYDFMRRYKVYFGDFNITNARVALLFSNNLAYQFALDDPGTLYYRDDEQLGREFYRLGVDYDIIDPAMTLDKYHVVVLPRTPSMAAADAQTLLAFVNAGGKLVILNQPADGGSILKPGQQGKGEIVKFSLDDPAGLASLVAYIKGITGAIQSDSTPALSAISYTDGSGNYVVHLMTSHTDLSQDFPVLNNIQLTLPFTITGQKVSYASLENPDLVSLDTDKIVIPSLITYGMLVIENP